MKAQPIPEDWANKSPIHQQALEHCRANAAYRNEMCICCGCHTDGVDDKISDVVVIEMIRDAECPMERLALARILASRRV